MPALARIAVPALMEALRDPDASVRDTAADALVEIGEPAVPALIDALREPELRDVAASALDRIGPAARAVR